MIKVTVTLALTLDESATVNEVLGEYFSALAVEDQNWMDGVSVGALDPDHLEMVAELAYHDRVMNGKQTPEVIDVQVNSPGRKKDCPLTFNHPAGAGYCAGPDCAWFSEECGQCAPVALAEHFRRAA